MIAERPLCLRLPEAVYNAVWEHVGRAAFCVDQQDAEKAAVELCLVIADHFDVRYTADEVMTALGEAFPSPRTSRDCIVEKNLRDNLSVRENRVAKASRSIVKGEADCLTLGGVGKSNQP